MSWYRFITRKRYNNVLYVIESAAYLLIARQQGASRNHIQLRTRVELGASGLVVCFSSFVTPGRVRNGSTLALPDAVKATSAAETTSQSSAHTILLASNRTRSERAFTGRACCPCCLRAARDFPSIKFTSLICSLCHSGPVCTQRRTLQSADARS